MALAVSAYQWYLMVHILATVIWVGGSHMLVLVAGRIQKSNDPPRMAGFAKDIEWIGSRIFAPTSLVLLVFGFLLVEEGDVGYPFWVIFGLAVFGYSFVMGVAFFGPESGRIAKLIDARGATDPELASRLRRLLLLARIELLLLVLVIVDMTIKPFS